MKIISLTEIEKITNGNEQSMKELLQVFINEASSQIKNLKSQKEKEDWDGLKRTAHKVKTSLLLVGMNDYRRFAEEIERHGGTNHKKTEDSLEKLIPVYSNALVELKKELKKLS